MVTFAADQENLALIALVTFLGDDLTDYVRHGTPTPRMGTARNMMSLARYVSCRGHMTPVVSAGADGKRHGVTYDGVWCIA